MNLVIDIGNTSVKVCLFENDKIISKKILEEASFLAYIKSLSKDYNIKNTICSSVTSSYRLPLVDIINETNYYELTDRKLKIPFKNNYNTKVSLGQDRIGLVSAAYFKFPNQNSLVIDVGTCITYDFIDSKNIYHGGAISPGVKMRYKSFSEFTSNLPFLKFNDVNKIIGSSTADSIHIGVSTGIIGEINEHINRLEKKYTELNIIITGGDSAFLLNRIKNAIFADQDFLATGLNNIIKYNEGN
jgi:type III pantothenate kinase